MSASLKHKLWQSTTGLDDAGMDLRVAQFSAHTSQELNSATTPVGLEQQLPLPVVLCAIAGAILFAFLILLWLRQQMSREKDVEDGDRRGLVEEGTIYPHEEFEKNTKTKVLTEVKWVAEPVSETSKIATETVVTTATVVATIPEVPSSKSVQFEKVKFKTQSQCKPEAIPQTSSAELMERLEKPLSSSDAMAPCRQVKRSPRREMGNRRTHSMYSTLHPVTTSATSKPTDFVLRREPKGLLERRNSSVSLTIDLAPTPESPPHATVTPTRECRAEEFLLSASKVLTGAQLREAICNTSSLQKEFSEVPLNHYEETEVCGSGIRNRYKKILPNPRSRVVLPGSDDPLTSYINANYVRGYDDDVRYIATQGPLPNTIKDFWNMAWAERTPVIVMMTRLHEADKTKCEAYFPLEINSRIQAGPFLIINNSMDTRGGYTVRDLEIRHENERRTIQHYWYESWPDHSVPETADALISMAAEINSLPGPIIVHCSAGIGRTGSFIALATGMTQLIREGNVNMLGILCQMRYDRGGMVQTAEQYEFVHKALCLFEETLQRRSSKEDIIKEKPK